jgi:hypothetical protein
MGACLGPLWQSLAPVSWKRWWWLAVPALGVLEWMAHMIFAGQPPEAQDWASLETTLTELRQDDELVVVAPYWAEPHARAALGDTLMPLDHVARPDDTRFSRAIEISILGEDSALSGWATADERRVGKFRLRVLDNPNTDPPLVDLIDLLTPQTAAAYTQKGKTRTDCTWNERAKVTNGALHGHPTFPKRRFECSKTSDWNFVGVTVIEDENYRPRRCIWAHPAPGRKTIVVFRDVLLGSKIVGYGGLPYFVEREGKGSPVTLEVVVGDKKLGKMVHEDGEGWKRFEFSTDALAGQTHTIEVRTSAKKTHQREFCFQADVR